jgi:tetratricopeptide (TPR) repeat protein
MVEIAYVYSEMGDFTGALDLLIEITELDPEESSVWQSVARFSVEFEIEVEDVGLPAARQAVILAEDDPAALTLLGRAYMVLGDGFYPEDYFLQAISLDDSYPDAYLYLGLVYLGRGEMGKAKVEIEIALALGQGTLIGQTAQRVLDRYFP